MIEQAGADVDGIAPATQINLDYSGRSGHGVSRFVNKLAGTGSNTGPGDGDSGGRR